MAQIEKNQAIEAENKHKQLDRALMRQQGRRGALIEVLHEAQHIFGYLPRDILGYIAASLQLPPSHVFGVASFYPSFRLHPPAGHTITVCMGTACYVNGASRVLRAAEERCHPRAESEQHDRIPFDVHAVHCLGSCGSGPVMQVDDDLYLHTAAETVESALDRCVETLRAADHASDGTTEASPSEEIFPESDTTGRQDARNNDSAAGETDDT